MNSRTDELITKVSDLESQLQAADALAMAAKALLREEMKFPPDDMVTPRNNLTDALAAYERVRGLK